MKLAAIYNVWDGVELLRHSMDCLKGHVDVYIIVWQPFSNWGERYNPLEDIKKAIEGYEIPNELVVFSEYVPEKLGGMNNEILKRNQGLEVAKKLNCTHFLHIDADEMYTNFGAAKQQYIDSGAEGSVCKLYTYFKQPTWRFDTEDGYYVPFIHQLHPHTKAAREYPFYADPTRGVNCTHVVELPTHMHHMSWVRKDIERKARNSSAKSNIERGTMLQDYHNPNLAPGFYVRDYDKRLIEVPNYFNIFL
jgi:hypothetical protein